jgi:hypothetical protein
MKIHAIYCVFTSDKTKKENLIISENKDDIFFPIKEIEHPRYLHNEMHYNFQSLFKKTTYNPEILKNINFSHVDIQNDLIYKYLQEKQIENLFDIQKDLFLLCCAIVETKYELDSCFWKNFKFVKSFTDMDIISSIVDFAIEKSIL